MTTGRKRFDRNVFFRATTVRFYVTSVAPKPKCFYGLCGHLQTKAAGLPFYPDKQRATFRHAPRFRFRAQTVNVRGVAFAGAFPSGRRLCFCNDGGVETTGLDRGRGENASPFRGRPSFAARQTFEVAGARGAGRLQRFLCVSMQRTMYWLEQLRVCWPRSRPPARPDDWPAADTWSVRHASQCLSVARVPVLVEPCQMLFWGLKDRPKINTPR